METGECKRGYDLRKRLENSGRNRSAVIQAAKTLLEREGFLQFTMTSLAQQAGLSRQTIHNLFGTKVEVIEALFDRLALDAGMQNMRTIMQSSDPARMIIDFVRLLVRFWSHDRILIRRIHGLGAIDPDFGAVLKSRDQRRRMAAGRIISVLEKQQGQQFTPAEKEYHVSILYTLTSFACFDVLAETIETEEDLTATLVRAVSGALNLPLSSA